VTHTVSKTVSDETLNAIITIESAGKVNAKASTSSASGLGQFIDATWMGVVAKHRPDLLRSRSRAEILALRFDPMIMIELLARFTEDNQRVIGMNCTGGDLYLAHFLGTADAKDLFRAKPDTPVSQLVSVGVISANKSIMLGKTAGQVRAWAAKRMAASTGRNWIAKYYGAPPPQALLTEPEPEPEPTADEIPDPQDAPALPEPTVVVPVEAPTEVVEKQIEKSAARDAESSPSWLKRKWKAVTGWFGGGLGLGGVGLFDWKILAALTVAGILFGLIILWAIGPGSIRAWVRKQVS
jgi:hypothetical protein